MAIVQSDALAKVEAGMPPWLNSQMSRGQVLKHLITYHRDFRNCRLFGNPRHPSSSGSSD